MMRWSGSGGVIRFGVGVVAVLACAGCARRPVVTSKQASTSATSPEQAAEQKELTETALPAGAAAAQSAETLDIREIRPIEDNGQQGVFVKLTRPPAAITHYTLGQPTRLVIDIAGAAGGGETSAQKYSVQNPLIAEVRVTRHEGKIRVTLEMRAGTVP